MSRRVAQAVRGGAVRGDAEEGIPALREIERQLASVARAVRTRAPGCCASFEVPSVAPAAKRELVATIARRPGVAAGGAPHAGRARAPRAAALPAGGRGVVPRARGPRGGDRPRSRRAAGRRRPRSRWRRCSRPSRALLGVAGRARREGRARAAGRVRRAGGKPGLRRFAAPRRCAASPRRRLRRGMGMQIKVDEITDILRRQIQGLDTSVEMAEVGTVVSVGDGIARVFGLDRVMAGEMVAFPHDVFGLALNLEEDGVGCVLMGESQAIREGDEVRRTGRILQVPVGPALVGRVVERARPADRRQGPDRRRRQLPDRAHRPRRGAPPAGEGAGADRHQGDRLDDPDRARPARADHRRPPDRQDRDHRRHHHQPEGEGHDLHLRRDRPEALDRRAGRQDPRGLRRDGATRSWWPPPRRSPPRCSTWRRTPAARWASTSCTTAAHAVVFYDDLSKHAAAYREISLLLRRPPGREAYPGDVFYLHSRLLERAAKLRDDLGGGSLTAIPVIETQAGDVVGVHPDQRHLDHRRADLPGVRPLLLRRAPGGERRHLGLARRRQRPDQGDEEGGRHAAPRPRAVPRAGGVRPVRLRPRQGHAAAARPRRAPGRDPQAGPVPADAGRAARWPRCSPAPAGILDKLKVEAVLPFEALPARAPRAAPRRRARGHHRRPASSKGPSSRSSTAGCQAALDAFLREHPEAARCLASRTCGAASARCARPQQITKAMKMVAAAKLRRAQTRILEARPYAAALEAVLRSLAARVGVAPPPAAGRSARSRPSRWSW